MKGATLALGTLAGHFVLFLLGREAPDRQHCEASCHVAPDDDSGLGRAVLGAFGVLFVGFCLALYCCSSGAVTREHASGSKSLALDDRPRRPRISQI